MGKSIFQFVDFIIAAKNIEISYRVDRFTTMAEETPAKILLSTCTTISKPNRTKQHKIGPTNEPLCK
jgi:hypothetical protein